MEKYLLTREIAHAAIDCEGTIFGGYVRDFILHDHASKQFYKKGTRESYSDPSTSPETIDRLLIPRDVDVHFTKFCQYRKFKYKLHLLGLKSSIVKKDFHYSSHSFRHIKLNVHGSITEQDIRRHLSGFSNVLLSRFSCEPFTLPFMISVDVVISSDASPPFNNLDFECNGLIMNKNGIELCEDLAKGRIPEGKFRIFTSIVDDIKNKVARSYSEIDGLRWDKMIERSGWTVQSDHIEKVPCTCTDECIVCHEPIEEYVYKFRCCSARYHSECIGQLIANKCLEKSSCIHCRQHLELTQDEIDLFI